MSIQYVIGAILLKKSCQKRGIWKKDKDGEDDHIGGREVVSIVYRRGDSKYLHTTVYGLVFPYCASIFR